MARVSHKDAMRQLSELHQTLEIKLGIWLRSPSKAGLLELEQIAVEHADFLGQTIGLFETPEKRAWRSPGRPRKADADAEA